MQIREASEKDIPQILLVLKASLGETSSKKNAEVWRFKHINNPFGQSLVLIAEENEEIIGVRAFMRWQWQQGKELYSAFRAVDTATHPAHQGKGIFKKLTLKALEIGKQRGDHFVFNTPNKNSKPGYLKMGWKEVGKLRIHLIPVIPFYLKKKELYVDNQNDISALNNSELLKIWEKDLKSSGKLYTPKSIAYLQWRYLDNPLQNYFVKAQSDLFIAGYVKQRSRYRELRISELVFSPYVSIKSIKRIIRVWAKEYKAHFITLRNPKNKNIYSFKISGNFGPVLTYKQIDDSIKEDYFLNLDSWQYSLGDLELF